LFSLAGGLMEDGPAVLWVEKFCMFLYFLFIFGRYIGKELTV
jgi:hypothetical protein